jgi:hypothetical protein
MQEDSKNKQGGRITIADNTAVITSSTGEQLTLAVNSPNKQFNEQILSSSKDESLKDLL